MTETQAPSGIDLGPLTAWLESNLHGFTAPAEVTLIQGGRSNLTYGVVDGGGARYVLRRPPLGKVLRSAQDVSREWAFLVALAPTGVPTAAPLAHCTDTGVIGAPFFVMEHVGGATLADPTTAARLSVQARERLADEVTAVLAALHAQDAEAIGLSGFARPGGYFERQIRRWSRQIADYESLASDLIEPVRDRLAARIPRPQRVCVLHGDFKLANLRVHADGAIAAVLDWELAALGDPLADVGWLLASWAEPEDDGRWIVPPPTSGGGFVRRADLAAAYARKTGLDLTALDFYVAFSYWRWSCINEGIRARFASGVMGDQRLDLSAVEDQIRWQLERAWALLA